MKKHNGISLPIDTVSSIGTSIRKDLEKLIKLSQNGDDSAIVCFEAEKALSEPEFMNIPVGSAIGDFLSSTLYRKNASRGMGGLCKTILLSKCHYWLGSEFRHKENTEANWSPNRVLFAQIGSRSYHKKDLPKLVSAIGQRHCNVILNDESLKGVLPPNTGYLTWLEAPKIDHKRWRKEYARCSGSWRLSVGRLKKKYGFSSNVAALINDSMLVASQYIYRYGTLLDKMRPSAVVVGYDRNVRGACLVLAARARGIPTFTLVHGVINGPNGYTPVLADTILCWGEIQRKQLIEYGTDPQRIKVVGCERLTKKEAKSDVVRTDLRTKVGISEDCTVALLATNPINNKDRESFARLFCEAVSRIPKMKGIVRLHPSEKAFSYQNVINEYGNVHFTENDYFTHDEALSIADIVVVHSSGFGGEALLQDRLVVVLDALESPIGHGEILMQIGKAPRAKTANELVAVLNKMREDAHYRENLKAQAQNYVSSMFFALGEKVNTNIAETILETTRVKELRVQ